YSVLTGSEVRVASAEGEIAGFFFQAEDGIRDYKVTGVQTCALPISHHALPFFATGMFHNGNGCIQSGREVSDAGVCHVGPRPGRSEERRVGKECRWRWAPDQWRKRTGGGAGDGATYVYGSTRWLRAT